MAAGLDLFCDIDADAAAGSDMDDDMDEILAIRRQGDNWRIPVTETVRSSHLLSLRRTLRDWRLYQRRCGVSVDADQPFPTIPNKAEIYGFLRWLLSTKIGKLDPKISVATLNRFLKNLIRLIRDRTGRCLEKDTIKELGQAIRIGLVQKGASQKARKRPMAGTPVVIDLLYFLWACDEQHLEHPRTRLQVSVSVLLMLYLGLRPGEILESSAHQGSNEGFLYRDMTVNIIRKDKEVQISILLKIRNRKFRRQDETQDISMILMQDKGRPELCPVAQLLALGLADGAFAQVDTIEQLTRIQPPRKDRHTHTTLLIRPDMEAVPILRSINRDGALSSSRIALASQLAKVMIGLGERAGYHDRLTPYCVRRGHGNMLDRYVTAAVRRQRMGHRSDDTFQHYISSVSGVDSQAVMLERDPDMQTVEFLRSMITSLDPKAPAPPGSLLERSRSKHDRKQWLEERESYFKSQASYRVHGESLSAHGLVHSDANGDEVEDVGEDEAMARPPPSLYFRAFLRHDADRAAVIRNFYHRSNESLTLDTVLRPLVAIAAPNAPKWRYPDAEPASDGSCPLDGAQIKRSKDAVEFNFHLLKCSLAKKENDSLKFLRNAFKSKHQICDWFDCGFNLVDKSLEVAARHNNTHIRPSSRLCRFGACTFRGQTLGELKKHMLVEHLFPVSDTMPKHRFCFECREYRQTETDWDEHCAAHLSKLRMACGPVIHRGVVVMPSKCPFCLGNTSLPSRRRYAQFAKVLDFNRHLARHLCHDVAAWPFLCPHPLCKEIIDTPHDFWDHSADLHGLTVPKSDCRAFLSTLDLQRPSNPSQEPTESDENLHSDSSSAPHDSLASKSPPQHHDAQSWFDQEIQSAVLLPSTSCHEEEAAQSYMHSDCTATTAGPVPPTSDATHNSASNEPIVSSDQGLHSRTLTWSPRLSCPIDVTVQDAVRPTLAATGHVQYRSMPCKWQNQAPDGTITPCGRTFRGNYELRRHVVSHRRMESMTCPRAGCIRAFKKAANLQKHLDKDHIM